MAKSMFYFSSDSDSDPENNLFSQPKKPTNAKDGNEIPRSKFFSSTDSDSETDKSLPSLNKRKCADTELKMSKPKWFPYGGSDSKPEKMKNPLPSPGKKEKGTDGSKKWTLGNKRHVRVNKYRGIKLVDIREYYDKEGQELPAKKGMSLTIMQWKRLQEVAAEIDEALKG